MSKKHTAGSTAGPYTLLAEIAGVARDNLRTLTTETFGACDDIFFDLASRARSHTDQTRYFDSLREIRVQKERVQDDFLQLIASAFAAIDRAQEAPSPAAPETTRTENGTLELVSNEQLEISTLRTDMLTQAQEEWRDELYQVRERLQTISRPLPEDTWPLAPKTIIDAFLKALKNIDVDAGIVKVILHQFNREVLLYLNELLDPVNDRMIDAGLLPELGPLSRRRVRKHPSPAQSPAGDAGTAGGTASTTNAPGLAGMPIPETDVEMRELAQVLKRLHEGGIRLPALQDLPLTPASASSPPIDRDELLALLKDAKLAPEDDSQAPTTPIDIRSAIGAIVASHGRLSLARTEEDIVNVVAMFFDIILDDRNLPLEIQALVSRLQLPILKIALRDRTFFTERRHPARLLVNEIARTSLGWEASDKGMQDALFSRLGEIVEKVLHDADKGVGVFERCLDDLLEFVSRHEARTSKIEQRTRERTIARVRTEQSREAVHTLLSERLASTALAPDITDFLINDWKHVMLQRHLKYGEDSAQWQEVAQVLDDLVWAAQSHPGPAAKKRLRELLADLRKRVKTVLEDAGTDLGRGGGALKQLTAALAKIHVSQVGSLVTRPLTEQQRRQISPPPGPKPWEEMTAVERQLVRQQQLLEEYLAKADALEIGSWLQYDDLRGGVSRRCKLVARLPAPADTLVFVNRMGAKVYEKPRKAFAYDLQMGYARTLESRPFFDRTLERITSNLRKLVD